MSYESKSHTGTDYHKIVLKAWTDDAYRKRLQADPKSVLAEEGWKVPPGVDVKFQEYSANTCVFGLPPKPAGLADNDLRHAADTAACCCCC
jgi:hypothetical protein